MPKEKDEPDDKEADAEVDDAESDDDDDGRSFDIKYVSKISFVAFLLFIMINSDVFIERVLGRMHTSLVDGRSPTLSGVVVQGLVMSATLIVMAYAVAMEKI